MSFISQLRGPSSVVPAFKQLKPCTCKACARWKKQCKLPAALIERFGFAEPRNSFPRVGHICRHGAVRRLAFATATDATNEQLLTGFRRQSVRAVPIAAGREWRFARLVQSDPFSCSAIGLPWDQLTDNCVRHEASGAAFEEMGFRLEEAAQ